MPLLALLVLVVAEVAVLAVVVGQVGVVPTLGLLVLGTVVGVLLLRREGTRAWRAFGTAVAAGRPPGREVLDGLLVLIGGLLVLLPGFVSDVLGLLCLLPPTRRLIGRGLTWYALRRGRALAVQVRSRRMPPPGGPPPGPPGRTPPPVPPAPGAGRVIEGELDPPRGEPGPGPDPHDR